MTTKLGSKSLNWVIWGIAVIVAGALRKVLFVYGLPINLRFTSLVCGAAGSAMIVVGGFRYARSNDVYRLCSPLHLLKVRAWWVVCLGALVYGAARGNRWNDMGNEFLMVWMFGTFLLLGTDDRVWGALIKPMTVLMFVGIAFVLLHYTTPAPIVTEEQVSTIEIDSNQRYIGSIGMELNILLGAGSFLGIWALVIAGRNGWGKWEIAQVAGLFITSAINIGLFKFRGGVMAFAITIAAAIIVRPMLQKRRRVSATLFLLGACAIAIGIYVGSESRLEIAERFAAGDATGANIFGSRNLEAKALIQDLRLELGVGRGLGGAFDAFDAIGTEASVQWTTLHYGVLVFILKGGMTMFVCWIWIMLPALRLRSKEWFDNPCNLTAALTFPVLLFQFLTGPFTLQPYAIMIYVPAMMVLARFGRASQTRRI